VTQPLDLADPRWKGQVGMARPQFGTTRGLLGAMLHNRGPEEFRTWVQGLKVNDVRLYDGNSSVVKALAAGEISIGLTDSDDVAVGVARGWPVLPVATASSLAIPNTVALVHRAPHRASAEALIDFLLSERVERLMARSESRNIPARPRLAAELGMGPPPSPADLEAIAGKVSEALRVWNQVFGQ
jgi:iron(III) transport system substrate-binding protein